MMLDQALADAIRPRLAALGAALSAAGHPDGGQGLVLDGRELLRSDPSGARVELSAGAQAFVAGYAPPAPPAAPSYGGDLMTADEAMTEAAQAVANLRAYRGLATPTDAQRKAWENLVSRLLIYLIRQQFPSL